MQTFKTSFCFRGLLMMGITLVITVSTTSAQAELINGLPSSDSKPENGWGRWDHMQSSSHEPTEDSLMGQCNNNYDLSLTDPLDFSHCIQLEKKVEQKECKSVLVPDDFRFDILNGLEKGKSKPFTYKEKHTGRLDRALWCDLGNGVNAFWFTGVKNQSCNNLAWTFTEVPVPIPVVAPPVEPVVKTETRYVSPPSVMKHTGAVVRNSLILIPPPINNCCNCANFLVPNGAVILNNGQGLKSTGHSKINW